jgi:hypothetical protein
MDKIKCPFCSEEIMAEAKKCRFCGEFLNKQGMANPLANDPKTHASKHPSYGSFTVISLLIPIVGIVVGVVYLTKKNLLDRKLGEHSIAMSIVGMILGYILWSFVIGI